ncbi:MAG TPA: NINE protein [Verrucomicrobiae bacterium]|nr:NINE protein [Verrucomicrobiae bacterium]
MGQNKSQQLAFTMYKIIGADGREYGPVSAEQLRDWIEQGRVSLQTQARLEGGTEWKSLSGFPEFSTNPGVPPLLAARDERASTKLAAGICGILLGSLGVHKFILGYTGAGLIMLLVTLVAGVFTCGISSWAMMIIGLIEGILYLTKSDAEFIRTYLEGRKEWF